MAKVRSKSIVKKKREAEEAESARLAIQNATADEDTAMVELPKDKAEEELEKLVFGDMAGFQAALVAHEELPYKEYDAPDGELGVALGEDDEVVALEDSDLFFVDSGPVTATAPVIQNNVQDLEAATSKVAWEDSDDERLTISLLNNPRLRKLRTTELDDVINGKEYTKRLRRQFERINPVPEWALPQSLREPPRKRRRGSETSDSSSSSEEGMEIDIAPTESLSSLLQSSQGYTRKSKPGKLKPENLDIFRLRDANYLSPAKSGIQAISFHPTAPLLLSAGFDHVLRLNHIDTHSNPPATSLYLPSTPVSSASFHPDGRRVFASGRRRFFHIWDLESGAVETITRIYGQSTSQKSMEHFKLSPCGRFMSLLGASGTVNLLDASSAQWIASAKIEGRVSDVTWSRDGSNMMIANRGGEVWEYDTSQRKFSSRWTDEGGVGTTSLALSDRWCVVGSQSGIVNVYDRREFTAGETTNPIPKKTLGNLVTAINVLEFSEDGQLLCMASRGKGDALRMVHLPTCTVYKNWPTSSTPLGKVNCAAFAGDSSGLFAEGNEQGKVRLWEIR